MALGLLDQPLDLGRRQQPQQERDGLRDVERIFDIEPSPHRRRVDHDQAGEGLLRNTEARDVIAPVARSERFELFP